MKRYVRSFSAPDEVVEIETVRSEMITQGGMTVSHDVQQPGWRWATHIKPLVGTEWCQVRHEAELSGASYEAAEAAWAEAWGHPTVTAGVGGSIPLVASLHTAAPDAEILLGGAADGYANIHGPNERVLLDELERTTLAIADLFGRLAATRGGPA